jgi:hypothetical protein
MVNSKKLIYLLFLFSFCVWASDIYGQKWDKCPDPHAPGLDIYKHYRGTIGSKTISLDLRFGFCGGSNYGGSSYYYVGNEELTGLMINEPERFDLGVTLHSNEFSIGKNLVTDVHDPQNDRENNPHWEFEISGNKLTGKRHSIDGKTTEDVHLTEDYSESVALDMAFFEDPVSKMHLISAKPSPSVSKADADFISRSTLNFFTGKDAASADWPEYLKGFKTNLTGYIILLPVYNDDGFLVLEKQTGFAPASFSYLCLDVSNKKQLELKDIIKADNNALSSRLETAARKKYKLDAGKKLSTWFKSDKIPVTDKIMLTNTGINFCYDLSEIIPEKDYQGKFIFPDAPVKIFLSYAQLHDLLTADFRKRIGM